MIKLAWQRSDEVIPYSTLVHYWKVRISVSLAKFNGRILYTKLQKVLAFHGRVLPAHEVMLNFLNDMFLPADKHFICDI